jgi:hypothetical protein
MIWMIVPAAALTVLIAGCGSTGIAGSPSLTVTVSGSPSARVTDVTGYSLTKKQLNTIIKDCAKAGVPGTSQRCKDQEKEVRRQPRCGTRSEYCLIAGSIVGTDLGILKLRDQPSGGSRCGSGAGALCAGVVVPVSVIRPLTGASPASSSPSPSPSATTTPTGIPAPSVSPSTATATATAPPAAPPSGS